MNGLLEGPLFVGGLPPPLNPALEFVDSHLVTVE